MAYGACKLFIRNPETGSPEDRGSLLTQGSNQGDLTRRKALQ
jgi:hypothetical protein